MVEGLTMELIKYEVKKIYNIHKKNGLQNDEEFRD
jgi:hypothetical protein